MRVNGKNRPRTHERYERTLRIYFPFGDTRGSSAPRLLEISFPSLPPSDY